MSEAAKPAIEILNQTKSLLTAQQQNYILSRTRGVLNFDAQKKLVKHIKKTELTFEEKKQLLSRTKNFENRSDKYLDKPLFDKLFEQGGSESSVRTELNKFLKSRKRVFKWEVDTSLQKLRSFKHYRPALKLSENMAHRGFNKTIGDQAIHIDLLAKSRGISEAEDYFVGLPEASKNHICYSALFNCYCKELMTEKAEALMEKMKCLDLSLTSNPYNSLMTLYAKKGQHEKVLAVIQEMKSSGVMYDCFSYNVWIRALAALEDISGVERVIDEMKRDGRVEPDWTTYSNLASIYVNAGLNEKAESALKKLENKISSKDHAAFQFLITLYGRTGNILEVKRVWESLRPENTSNTSYLNLIQVLVNLKDRPGAEECFKDWEKNCKIFDIRVANVLIGAYTKDGLLTKAKKILNIARTRKVKPNAKTWEIFIDYHTKNGDFKSVLDCVVKAIDTRGRGGKSKWAPTPEIVKSLMENFENEKDVDGAESFCINLRKVSENLEAYVYESLIRTYSAAEKTTPSLRRRLKMEGVKLNETSEKLLETISVE